jgi:hypothetical protein
MSDTPLPREIELERIVSLDDAAKIIGISRDGLLRHHRHLIRQLTPRRIGMKLKDVIAIGSPESDQVPPAA